jgi:hypothetical protein
MIYNMLGEGRVVRYEEEKRWRGMWTRDLESIIIV